MTDLLGWLGTALVVLAYAGNIMGLIGSQERLYLALNLAGSCLLGMNVWAQEAWPAFALQLVWGLVALTGLIRNRT